MSFGTRGAVIFFICLVFFGIVLNPGCIQNEEPVQNLEIEAESQDNPVKHYTETITIEE